MEHLAEEIIT